MAKKRFIEMAAGRIQSTNPAKLKQFYLEFLTKTQEDAYKTFMENDILFLMGEAGSGKSHLAIAFAVQEILEKTKEKIILSRPIVEAGESLGFLPGEVEEKVFPYMLALYDCLDRICGKTGTDTREYINKRVELAPLAYLRGRAQPLNSIVMTPDGPRKMKDIKVDDLILGSSGQPVKVVGVYPQGKKPVVEVSFNDGSKTQCCKEHLWLTQTLSEKRHNKGFTVKTTEEISRYVKTNHGQKNHRIPMITAPVEFTRKEVGINPYFLGLLLGDGCLHEKANVTFSTSDVELFERAKASCPDGIRMTHIKGYDYRFASIKRKRWNPLKISLRELGLIGRKSYNKFVPDDYKYNSSEVRLAILQGLMDTDGSVWKDRNSVRVEFSTTSEALAKDVVFLVQSLGGTAFMYERQHNDNWHMLRGHLVCHRRNSFRVMIHLPPNINPFRLSRKAEKWAKTPDYAVRLISEIREIGEQECQCIKVEAPDHLYLTDNFIATHNTFHDSICILDEAQNCTAGQIKLFLTRLGGNSKLIITGDPSQSDLSKKPDILNVIDKIKHLQGVGVVTFTGECIVRHPLVREIVKLI